MPRTVYLVQQVHWEYNDTWYDPIDVVPQKVFVSEEAALQSQRILETQARRAVEKGEMLPYGRYSDNPVSSVFCYADMTSLPYETLIERLVHLRIIQNCDEYEDNISYDWQDFESPWKRIWDSLSDEKRDAYWSLFDRLRFYEVVAVEVGE